MRTKLEMCFSVWGNFYLKCSSLFSVISLWYAYQILDLLNLSPNFNFSSLLFSRSLFQFQRNSFNFIFQSFYHILKFLLTYFSLLRTLRSPLFLFYVACFLPHTYSISHSLTILIQLFIIKKLIHLQIQDNMMSTTPPVYSSSHFSEELKGKQKQRLSC